MRLPAEALQPQLGPILEGVLLWAADSKNKFKLKVRTPMPAATDASCTGSLSHLAGSCSVARLQRTMRFSGGKWSWLCM